MTDEHTFADLPMQRSLPEQIAAMYEAASDIEDEARKSASILRAVAGKLSEATALEPDEAQTAVATAWDLEHAAKELRRAQIRIAMLDLGTTLVSLSQKK